MKSLQLALTAFLFVFALSNLQSQGWRKTYDVSSTDYASMTHTMPDGGFLLVGSSIVKTDANGSLQWSASFPAGAALPPGNYPLSNNRSVVNADGSFAILLDQNSQCLLAKYSPHGQLSWTKTYLHGTQLSGVSLASSFGGGYVLLTKSNLPSPNNGYSPWMIKTDANGEVEFEKYVDATNLAFWGNAIISLSNGSYAIVGSSQSSAAATYHATLLIADSLGNTLLEEIRTDTLYSSFSSVLEAPDHHIMAVGATHDNFIDYGLVCAKFDLSGNQIWSRGYSNPSDESQLPNLGNFGRVYDLEVLPNNEFALCLAYNGGYTLLKSNVDGDILWHRLLSTAISDLYYYSLSIATDGGYAVGGQMIGANNPESFLLVKLDSLGNMYSHLIKGNAFHDEDYDCLLGQENGLRNLVVKASGTQDYYGYTDSLGNYEILVDTGHYEVSVVPYIYWENCQPSYSIYAAEIYDTTYVDIPLQSTIYCPFLTVDISSSLLRPCMQATYAVNYCNNGSLLAEGATVAITLPDSVQFLSAINGTLLSQNGQELVFDIGDVDINECGSIYFSATVACDLDLVGQTLCTQAQISPHDLCVDDPFNGPVIEVQGICQNDSIKFTIINKGGDMGQPYQYLVIEDNIILLTDEFELLENQSFATHHPAAAGATYHLVVAQDPNLPSYLGNHIATASVEGCVGLANPGMFNQMPQGNGQAWTSTICREVTASYDPNDKTGFPTGWTEEHLIDERTELEYLIRFQNTGTDTAFRVVLIDTLSAFLDPTTIRPGASSHPYTFELSGQGVARFVFDDILLPDSTTNEAASHGFVQFKIAQKAGPNGEPNQPGTVIQNTAGIYFDFNAPIYTNTTFHTIREPWVDILDGSTEAFAQGLSVSIAPNPMSAWATVEVANLPPGENELLLFDAMGREVLSQHFSDGKTLLLRDNLEAGLFFFRVGNDGKLLATGKLVVR